jgi:hypothetical protein
MGLDHGVGHFIEMTSQQGLQQGRSLAIFSHDIHTNHGWVRREL